MWVLVAAKPDAGWAASLAGALASRPTMALLLASLGGALLLLEFHRPGWVVPGASGVALGLLGGYCLALQPLRWWAVWMLAMGMVLLLVPWRRPGWAMAAAAPGVLLLCVGLRFLLLVPDTGWVRAATADGLVLGSAAGVLVTVAGRARQRKASRGARVGVGSAPRRDGAGGAGERWE